MTAYTIRPKYWAEQIVTLLPQLRADDLLHVPTPASKLAADLLLNKWGHLGIKVAAEAQAANCLRCGGLVYGNFCNACDGNLHTQTCPALWHAVGVREHLFYLREMGILDINPDDPCNCGGDDLEYSIRHATNDLRLQPLHGGL